MAPERTELMYPFVISLPHCSSRVPPDIRRSLALSDEEIEESTDVGTAEIFGAAPAMKVLCAEWSRLTVDLNRDPAQRDQKGVVAFIDYEGRNIYHKAGAPDQEEVERRILAYYRPYHDRLRAALRKPGVVGLIDCHSLYGIGPPEAPDPGEKRKDLVLSNNGDHRGCDHPTRGRATCPSGLLTVMKRIFEEQGFSVSINRPYAGGFITTHYGRELVGVGKMAVQIEINQDLYCEPGSLRLASEKVRAVRQRVLAAFSEMEKRMP
ncbi:MAG: N-formylglutamate amidohydrolase [Deltaproteobacteria bacterium]|nr:N-formylglutamate amidohydrolase [Deltaproteobacteria bacterium]